MPRGITEDDVIAAADTLLSRGERPTIERVRLELGRGSPNTVNRHLETWWTTLAQRMTGMPGAATGVPDEVVRSLSKAWQAAEEQARIDAASQLESRMQEVDAREKAIDAREQSLSSELERLKGDNALLRQEAESQKRESKGARVRAERLDAQVSRLQSELDTVRKKNEEREKDAEDRLDKANARFESALGQFEANERRWLAELDAARQAREKLEMRLGDVERRHQAELDQREQAIRLVTEERDSAREDFLGLQSQLAGCRTALKEAHALAKEERMSLKRELAKAQSTAAKCSAKLAASEAQLAQQRARATEFQQLLEKALPSGKQAKQTATRRRKSIEQ